MNFIKVVILKWFLSCMLYLKLKRPWYRFYCVFKKTLTTDSLVDYQTQQEMSFAGIRVQFPVQGSICVADILPNSPGWLSTYLKVLGTVHKRLLT